MRPQVLTIPESDEILCLERGMFWTLGVCSVLHKHVLKNDYHGCILPTQKDLQVVPAGHPPIGSSVLPAPRCALDIIQEDQGAL